MTFSRFFVELKPASDTETVTLPAGRLPADTQKTRKHENTKNPLFVQYTSYVLPYIAISVETYKDIGPSLATQRLHNSVLSNPRKTAKPHLKGDVFFQNQGRQHSMLRCQKGPRGLMVSASLLQLHRRPYLYLATLPASESKRKTWRTHPGLGSFFVLCCCSVTSEPLLPFSKNIFAQLIDRFRAVGCPKQQPR